MLHVDVEEKRGAPITCPLLLSPANGQQLFEREMGTKTSG